MAGPGRRLGLDVGDVRIGIAISDPLGVVATPLDVLQSAGLREDTAAIAKLIEEHEIVVVVVGMPLTAKGERGHQAEKTQNFVDALRAATDVEITTIDERFTSAMARRTLNEINVRGKRRKEAKKKGVIDQIAAQQILQTYLDRTA